MGERAAQAKAKVQHVAARARAFLRGGLPVAEANPKPVDSGRELKGESLRGGLEGLTDEGLAGLVTEAKDKKSVFLKPLEEETARRETAKGARTDELQQHETAFETFAFAQFEEELEQALQHMNKGKVENLLTEEGGFFKQLSLEKQEDFLNRKIAHVGVMMRHISPAFVSGPGAGEKLQEIRGLLQERLKDVQESLARQKGEAGPRLKAALDVKPSLASPEQLAVAEKVLYEAVVEEGVNPTKGKRFGDVDAWTLLGRVRNARLLAPTPDLSSFSSNELEERQVMCASTRMLGALVEAEIQKRAKKPSPKPSEIEQFRAGLRGLSKEELLKKRKELGLAIKIVRTVPEKREELRAFVEKRTEVTTFFLALFHYLD